MKREILFRAKVSHFPPDESMRAKWVEGFYYQDLHDGKICHFIKCAETDFMVDPETVGQYTGLKDRNNTKIFDGDICLVKTMHGRAEAFTVEWGIHRRTMATSFTVDIPSFAFMVDGKATFPIVDNFANCHDLELIEVIGNIHDKPTLP